METDYSRFDDLTREHAYFLRFLKAAENMDGPSDALFEFASLLEHHHRKEERLLFAPLVGSPALDVGGPKCMTFFTPRVIGGTGWVDPFQALTRTLAHTASPPPAPHQQTILETGCMLRIPIEDHIAGNRALSRLLSGQENFREGMELFSAFLRDHIRREDECLFHLFRRELSERQKKEYAVSARALDGDAGILSRLERLPGQT